MTKPQKVNEMVRDEDLGRALPKETGALNTNDSIYSTLYLPPSQPKANNRKT